MKKNPRAVQTFSYSSSPKNEVNQKNRKCCSSVEGSEGGVCMCVCGWILQLGWGQVNDTKHFMCISAVCSFVPLPVGV